MQLAHAALLFVVSLAPLLGEWRGEMKLGDRTVAFALTFAAKDQALSGTMNDASGATVALEKVTLEDKVVRFNVRDVSFEGTINGDTISGRMHPGGTWSVRRGSADVRSEDQVRTEAMRALEAQNFEKAIADLTKAIAINPKKADYYVLRGLAYRDSGQLPKAIADFTSALPLDPNNPTIHFARGTAYFMNDEYKNAVADLTRAIALNPNEPAYYRWRAKAYKALDMIDEAVADELKAQ